LVGRHQSELLEHSEELLGSDVELLGSVEVHEEGLEEDSLGFDLIVHLGYGF
jgi:hypothetical protein